MTLPIRSPRAVSLLRLSISFLFAAVTTSLSADPMSISTFAGTRDLAAHSEGRGSAAAFSYPVSIASDLTGNLFVADAANHVIRRIDSTGEVSTLAGAPGVPGDRDGFGAAAQFRYPNGITVDRSGMVYVADTENCLIRKITPQGLVSTLSGSREGCGYADGLAATARFSHPTGLAVDITGVVFVADRASHSIRRVATNGTVITHAGNGLFPGAVDDRRLEARFTFPFAIAIDAIGNLFVADSGNHTIRRISPDSVVSTYCGSLEKRGSQDGPCDSARFDQPSAISVASDGTLYVADTNNHTVRKITPERVVSTVAGVSGSPGFRDAAGTEARFRFPYGVAVTNDGSLAITDMLNHLVRKGSERAVTPARRRPVR